MAESPLRQIRDRLALAVGENAVFDGWTVKAVESAAAQLGIDPAQARLAFHFSNCITLSIRRSRKAPVSLHASLPSSIHAIRVEP
jgi:hypothetical protein